MRTYFYRICFFVLTIIFLPIQVVAQISQIREDFIEKYSLVAITEMETYGIPASIKLAQGILESADGTSKLAKEANNHFGIKCHRDWQGGRVYHDDDQKNECFRKYKKAEDSWRDHSLFLVERERYQELFKLKRTDYKAWAYGLKKAGYATNPKYPELLINIIEENNLHHFDLKDLSNNLVLSQVKQTENGVSFVIIEDETNWEDLADSFGIKTENLLEWNELTYDSPLAKGDKVFIQKKRNKAKVKVHKVLEKENMRSIAHLHGVKLHKLYKRNKMPYGSQPKVGTLLKMR